MLLATTAREREVIPWHSSAQPFHSDKKFVKLSDVKLLQKIVKVLDNKSCCYLTHCCIKCPQNLQVKTLLQTYTAFTCRIYKEILLKVFDPRNRGNLLLKLQFIVL
jgi:hypothetical protein